jgi:hypothetical protein
VADPDRQELVSVGGLQEDDRLLADDVEADAVDVHLLQSIQASILILAQPPRAKRRLPDHATATTHA